MKWFQSSFLFIYLAVFTLSCNSVFVPSKAEYEDYKITDSLGKDSSLAMLMKPYKDSVYEIMKEVVGIVDYPLERKKPESPLGNFVADAILYSAKQKFNTHIDAAFVNHSGIRINTLPKGPVSKENIFELMPFENALITQQLKGTQLQQFLDFIAQEGGWPSAGIKMQIQNKKAVNILIGGKQLVPDNTYTLAYSDFIANGGDNAVMLISIPQHNIGYLLRDAIFDYIKYLNVEGKNISAQIENRISHVQ